MPFPIETSIMTKHSDTQVIILSSAGQRGRGGILPLPGILKLGGGAAKALAALILHGLIGERETDDLTATLRRQDERRIGLFATEAGADCRSRANQLIAEAA